MSQYALPSSAVICDPSPGDRGLGTDHLLADLGGRSVRGGIVTVAAQAAKFSMQTGLTVILARLLTPADFGLVAIAAAFTGFVALFNDLGLSTATIQRPQVTHDEVSTLFWLNVAISGGLAIAGAIMAPVLAWFYAEPRLVGITVAISATFILGGVTAQPYAILVRRMSFGAMAFVQTVSFTFGAAVGITLALSGAGYWSIVGMGAGTALATAVGSCILSGWRPSFPARCANLGAMLQFGGTLTGCNVLTYAVRNLDNLLIGYACGAAPLGLYSKAYGLVLLPVQQINSPLNGVLLPTLSRLQGQPERYRRCYLAAVGLLAMINMPLIAFAWADARIVVLAILGSAWAGAIPLLQLLAPAAMIGTVGIAADWALLSFGQAPRLLQWSMVSGPSVLLAFLIGIHWGAAGVAAALSTMTAALAVPMFWWALRYSPVTLADLASALWRPFCASALASMAFWVLVRYGFKPARLPLALARDTLAYFSIYSAILMVLPGRVRFFCDRDLLARPEVSC